jgi:hypothetical protein
MNKMKIILFVAIQLNIGMSLFAQNLAIDSLIEIDTLYRNQIYTNFEDKLISEKIIVFDSVPKNVILEKFENWAGITFRNYNEIITSKTESQITLVYILNEWYFRLVAQFKESKIKVSIYDDGNLYRPAIGTAQAAKAARSDNLNFYFTIDSEQDSDKIIFKTLYKKTNFPYRRAVLLIDYKNKVDGMILKIEEYIKKSKLEKPKDDW